MSEVKSYAEVGENCSGYHEENSGIIRKDVVRWKVRPSCWYDEQTNKWEQRLGSFNKRSQMSGFIPVRSEIKCLKLINWVLMKWMNVLTCRCYKRWPCGSNRLQICTRSIQAKQLAKVQKSASHRKPVRGCMHRVTLTNIPTKWSHIPRAETSPSCCTFQSAKATRTSRNFHQWSLNPVYVHRARWKSYSHKSLSKHRMS